MAKKKKAYMCGVDWQHELGEASGGNTLYPSVKDLKAHCPCWESCGIVEVMVEESKWRKKQNLLKGSKSLKTWEELERDATHLRGKLKRYQKNLAWYMKREAETQSQLDKLVEEQDDKTKD